jgi:hypothetical protein
MLCLTDLGHAPPPPSDRSQQQPSRRPVSSSSTRSRVLLRLADRLDSPLPLRSDACLFFLQCTQSSSYDLFISPCCILSKQRHRPLTTRLVSSAQNASRNVGFGCIQPAIRFYLDPTSPFTDRPISPPRPKHPLLSRSSPSSSGSRLSSRHSFRQTISSAPVRRAAPAAPTSLERLRVGWVQLPFEPQPQRDLWTNRRRVRHAHDEYRRTGCSGLGPFEARSGRSDDAWRDLGWRRAEQRWSRRRL